MITFRYMQVTRNKKIRFFLFLSVCLSLFMTIAHNSIFMKDKTQFVHISPTLSWEWVSMMEDFQVIPYDPDFDCCSSSHHQVRFGNITIIEMTYFEKYFFCFLLYYSESTLSFFLLLSFLSYNDSLVQSLRRQILLKIRMCTSLYMRMFFFLFICNNCD